MRLDDQHVGCERTTFLALHLLPDFSRLLVVVIMPVANAAMALVSTKTGPDVAVTS
jgi:hypothetical protein